MTSIAPKNDANTPVDTDEELIGELDPSAAQASATATGPDISAFEEFLDGSDDEQLPPPELPAEYLAGDRVSLSETDAYSAHLNEHWGF
jgi:hypothetical protein